MVHLGYERTLELIKECFLWSKMCDNVKYFVTKICKYIKGKTPNTLPQAPLKIITSSLPMELSELDLLNLDTCTGAFQYLLFITDPFARYAQVYSTRNKEAKTAATKLFNDYILRFGTPSTILRDQGREFENKLFTHLPKLGNTKRLCTTLYHPHYNDQVERMIKLITVMLKTLEETENKSWKNHVKKILEVTNKTTQQTPSKFDDNWRNQMSQAYKIASTNSTCRKRKDIARHNSKRTINKSI